MKNPAWGDSLSIRDVIDISIDISILNRAACDLRPARGLSLWCSSLETTASGVVPSPMVRGMDVEARESLPATVPDETVLKTIEVRSHLYPAQDGIFDKKRSLAKGAFVLHDSSVNGKAGEAWTKAQVASAESAAVEADAKAKAEVAKARVAEAVAVEAEAKARVAEAEVDAKVRAAEAEAEAKAREAEAKARAAEDEAKVKARIAEAEAVEAEAKAREAEAKAREADAKAKAEVAKARAADANARAADAEASAKVRVAKAQSLKADISIFKLRRELDVAIGEFGVKKYLSVRLSHRFLT